MPGAPRNALVRFWRDPALPGVEARSSTFTRNAFRTHTHTAWIIAAIAAGRTRFFLGDEPRPHDAGPGDLVIIAAGTPHACNPEPGGPFSYRLVALDTAWLAAAAPDGNPLRPTAPVLRDAELFSAWLRLHAAFVGGTPAGEKRGLLAACLARLEKRHAAPCAHDIAGSPPRRPAPSPAVARALAFMDTEAGRLAPLDELARVAGLSRCRFARVFRAETGLPPHVHQMQRAIERAKKLLAAGEPISHVAVESGFADQSHFSRRFREFTGATPGQYAAM